MRVLDFSMATYLVKTEPGDYSFEDLQREGSCTWDGVMNAQACAVLRTMSKGDDVYIYHTGDEKRIVGIAKVMRGAYPDPASADEKTKSGEMKYPVVDLKPVKPVLTPITLGELKDDERFADFPLVRQGRLSVMNVPPEIDKALRSLTGLG